MADDFAWDVFIAYSQSDAAVARDLARRLRKEQLRVWLTPGRIKRDEREAKIEEGLERSRVLVLCMSAAFGDDWVRLETQTRRFRDPLNIHRDFVPLHLDDAPIPGSLMKFASLNWRSVSREEGRPWQDLLDFCRPPAALSHPSVDQTPGQPGPQHAIRLHHGAAHVQAYAFSPDGRQVVPSGSDRTVRVWDLETGRCISVLDGHNDPVKSMARSPDGHHVMSGSTDDTVRVWDLETGQRLRVLEGHTGTVYSVAWSPDDRHALSGSDDKSVRLWDLEDGRCLRVLEGHAVLVLSVAWNPDGRRAFSGDSQGGVRIWDLSDVIAEAQSSVESGSVVSASPAQVQYTNAKVLLVGETGAGKTGLSRVLAGQPWEPSDSTVGAWATQWKLPIEDGKVGSDGVEREIWLWDFGGQADQRLIHQLYMDETALAVLVFDGQKEDVFDTLGQWDRDLTRASQQPFTKLLAAGRVDAGGLRVSRSRIEAFARERQFSGRVFETSAKVGTDCHELKAAICAAIDWDAVPWRTSPLVFRRLKEEIVRLKDERRVLLRFSELRDTLRLRLAGDAEQFTDEQLKSVIGLLTGSGVVWELKFGEFVLLQPEIVNAYAQAVIQTMREDQHERGCILEERVLGGDLTYHSSMQRLAGDEERFVLLAMHQILLERGLCLREHTELGPLLIFPSYYRRERPELVEYPAVHVSYQFNGFLDDVYATLVVRLHHTSSFEQDDLWRYAADFKTLTGKKLGVKLTRRAEGVGELDVYFDPTIPMGEKIIFSRYVHEHLLQKARDVVRLRYYVCPHCGKPVESRVAAMMKLNDWLEKQPPGASSTARPSRSRQDDPQIICVYCEEYVPLWDAMEQHFASDETRRKVRELQEQAAIVLDTGDKERTLVGEVIATASQAGQIARELTVADHGIDMEIELKRDPVSAQSGGEATGRKLYLQLKSGDSHLERRRDGREVFRIKEARHARYWMDQQFPVMLVIRTSDGVIRWMEIREYLRRESDGGRKQVRQIVFDGERFDVTSMRRWRDRALRQASQ